MTDADDLARLCERLEKLADDAATWNGHRMREGATAEFGGAMREAAATLRRLQATLDVVTAENAELKSRLALIDQVER